MQLTIEHFIASSNKLIKLMQLVQRIGTTNATSTTKLITMLNANSTTNATSTSTSHL